MSGAGLVVILVFAVVLPSILIGVPYLGLKELEKWKADPDAAKKEQARNLRRAKLFRRVTLALIGVGLSLLLFGMLATKPAATLGAFLLLGVLAPFSGFGWFMYRYPYARSREGTYLSWDESIKANAQTHYPKWARLAGKWLPAALGIPLVLLKACDVFYPTGHRR